MNVSKVKALFVVFALLLVTGVVTVGCNRDTKTTWVNTGSLPGQTFRKPNTQQGNSRIVYLGSNSTSSGSGSGSRSDFGPRDVSFEFNNLR